MRALRALVPVLALLVAAPAGATHGGNHPTFRDETVYFHCTGQTKVYQVNWLSEVGAESSFARWDTSAPSQSVTDGGGCGALDAGWVTNDLYDAAFIGNFTGNLREMTVSIHEFLLGNTRTSTTQKMRVYAEIDGVPLFPKGTTEGAYTGRGFTVTPVVDNGGATHFVEFSITNIGYATDIFDAEGKLIDVETGGAALEDGNGTGEHTIKMFLGMEGFPGEDPPLGGDMWVWDTTEVPSGIVFNPQQLSGDTVAADLPNFP